MKNVLALGLGLLFAFIALGAEFPGKPFAALDGPTFHWEHRSNCTLQLEKHAFNGAGALLAQGDLSQAPYFWVRLRAKTDWDAKDSTGLRFWYRGTGENCRVTVFLVWFDQDGESSKRSAYLLPLPQADWRRVVLPWDSFGVTPEEAAKLQSVHFTVESRGKATTATLELAGLALDYSPVEPLVQHFADTASLCKAFDLSLPALQPVQAALAQGDAKAAGSALVAYLKRRERPGYFYSDSDRERIEQLLLQVDAHYPAHIAAHTKPAEELKFTFEGFTASLGEDPVWDFKRLGVPWVWGCHLTRMGWLVPVGQAYWATGDEHYTRLFMRIVRDFIQKNPVPDWPNRASVQGEPYGQSLEVAVRLSSWIQCYYYFRNSPVFDDAAQLELLKAMLEHARWLEALEELTGFRTGNFQVIETTALAEAGLVFPEFKESSKWRKTAFDLIKKHLLQDTYPDGSHSELTPNYQAWCIRQYQRALALAKLNSYPLPEELWQRFEKLHEWYAWMQMPDGHTPCPGDGSRFATDRFLAYAAVAFDRPDLKYLTPRKGLPPEYYWVGGLDLIKPYAAMEPAVPKWGPSTLLPYAHYAILRSGWHDWRYGNALFFDAAPWAGGHSHPDALNFDLALSGELVLAEAGIRGYAHPHHRDYFHAAPAHNVLTVDGVFTTARQYPALLAHYLNGQVFDCVAASVAQPATHTIWQRAAVYLRPEVFLVVDRVEGKGEHTLARLLHPAEKVKFKLFPPAKVLLETPKGLQVQVIAADEPYLSLSNNDGAVQFEGKPQVFAFRTTARLPWESAFVVAPLKAQTPLRIKLLDVQGRQGAPASLYQVQYGGRTWRVKLQWRLQQAQPALKVECNTIE